MGEIMIPPKLLKNQCRNCLCKIIRKDKRYCKTCHTLKCKNCLCEKEIKKREEK